jgi:hypothetical protein
MPEIKTIWVTIRPSRDDGDPGSAEIGHYSVVDGVVVMCDEAGRPTGHKLRLGPGDNPHTIAGRLTREAWARRATKSDFNRPLNYPRWGMA